MLEVGKIYIPNTKNPVYKIQIRSISKGITPQMYQISGHLINISDDRYSHDEVFHLDESKLDNFILVNDE